MGAQVHKHTEPPVAVAGDRQALKEECKLARSNSTAGGLEGGLLMQSGRDKQDANCHHEQSNV